MSERLFEGWKIKWSANQERDIDAIGGGAGKTTIDVGGTTKNRLDPDADSHLDKVHVGVDEKSGTIRRAKFTPAKVYESRMDWCVETRRRCMRIEPMSRK